MCNYLTKSGVTFSLAPKKDICYIHAKYLLIERKQTEIRNLNQSISKKN